MKYKISILVSSKNKFLINQIIDNFKFNKVEHEILIVGPFKNYNHKNIRIIESFTKPAQCYEIAINQSKSNKLMLWADDMNFIKKKGSLDKYFNFYKKQKNKLTSLILSNEINSDINSYKFHHEIPSSPFVPISPILDKKMIIKLGSIDKRFIATLFDVDLYLRILTNDYKVAFSNIKIFEKKINNYSLNQDYQSSDRKLIDNLWTRKSKKFQISIFGDKIYKEMLKNRSSKTHKFNYEKMHIPQGNHGRWRYNNKLYYLIANKIYFFIFKRFFQFQKIRDYIYLVYRRYLKI